MSQARARQNNPVTLSRAEAEAIVAKTDAVMAALAEASAQFERPYMNDTWIDALMLTTKALTREVTGSLRQRLQPPS